MNSQSKLLITGASGLSGFIAVQEFAKHGYPVNVLIRNPDKQKMFSSLPNVTVFTGDMSKPETTVKALEGIEKVFLISTANNEMQDVQCSFIDTCKKTGVPHVIKWSRAESCIGYDPNKFLFTRMHEQIEDYLENSGLTWTHLRPSQFMQVYLREIPTIKKDSAFYLPLENIQMSPIDIEDVAAIAFQILSKGGYENRSLNMTGPEALTMSEIAQHISKALNKTIRYIPISLEERHLMLLETGMSKYFVEALDDQTNERLKHPISKVSLETHQEFGIKPTGFTEFLNKNINAFKN